MRKQPTSKRSGATTGTNATSANGSHQFSAYGGRAQAPAGPAATAPQGAAPLSFLQQQQFHPSTNGAAAPANPAGNNFRPAATKGARSTPKMAPPPVSNKQVYPTLSQAFGTSPSPQQLGIATGTETQTPISAAMVEHLIAASTNLSGSFGGARQQSGSRSFSPMVGPDGTPVDVTRVPPASTPIVPPHHGAGESGAAGGNLDPPPGDEPLELDSWDLQLEQEFSQPKTPGGGTLTPAGVPNLHPPPTQGSSPKPHIFATARTTRALDGAPRKCVPTPSTKPIRRPSLVGNKQPSPVEVINAVLPPPPPSEVASSVASFSKNGAGVKRPHFTSTMSEASAAPTNFSTTTGGLSIKERVEILVNHGVLGVPMGGGVSSAENSPARNTAAVNGGPVSEKGNNPPAAAQSSLHQLKGLRKPPGTIVVSKPKKQHRASLDLSEEEAALRSGPLRARKAKSNISCTGTVGTIVREMVLDRPLDSALTDELRKALEQRPSNPIEVECLRNVEEGTARRKNLAGSRKARRHASPKSDTATRSVDQEIRGTEIDRRSGGGSNGQFSSDSFGSYATSNTMSTSPSWCFGEQTYKIQQRYEPLVWDETNTFLPLEVREVKVADGRGSSVEQPRK